MALSLSAGVTAKIDKGATGEAYRARDSRLSGHAGSSCCWLLALGVFLGTLGCGDSTSPTRPTAFGCGAYPDWQTSAYILPYPTERSYRVSQASCSGFSHSGLLRYAVDFEMPIGTSVVAARNGIVVYVIEEFVDGDDDWYHSNLVRIDHADGTYALYAHLTQNGALVEVGDAVVAGEIIARSGNTGYTLDLPHLHFQVAPCSFYENCGTLPVTFRNTAANPQGLVYGRYYTARAD